VGRQEIRPPAVAYKAAAVEAPIERSFLKRLFLLVRGASVKSSERAGTHKLQ
jgi:hypothetical protein